MGRSAHRQSDGKSLLRTALGQHRAGRLDQAEASYRRILERQPAHPDVLHLLGLIASEKGAHERAVELLRAALEASPRAALFHANLGLALARKGEWGPAILAYCRAVELEPRNPDLLVRLGRGLEMGGRRSEAHAAYQQAAKVAPDCADPRFLLGNLARNAGELDSAEAWYRAALAVAPRDGESHFALATLLAQVGRTSEALVHYSDSLKYLPPSIPAWHAWFELGNALHAGGKLEESSQAYERSLAMRPDYAEAHFNLGVTRLRQGRTAEAAAAFRRTLELDPGHAGAHHNLATLEQVSGSLEQAIAGYGAALARQPDFVEARYNLASALQNLGQLEEAERGFRELLRQVPQHVPAHLNLGTTLLALGRFEEAQTCFERARDLQRARGATTDSDYREACWNLGVVELLRGDWERGWKGYEYRLAEGNSAARRFEEPLWNGEPYEGETLLVHAEQGLGDTLQFARYLRLAKRRGGALIFECHPDLVELMRSLSGPDQVVARGGELPRFDRHSPLMSLPRVFGTTVDTVPAAVPYLHPDAARALDWRERFSATGARNVGLVWAGNPRHKNDRNRSILAGEFAALAPVAGIRFFSLQQSHGDDTPPAAEFVDLAAHLKSVADTAAIVSQLDLVISVDTMVAHLAGALAKPVWTLVTFSPDWRWLIGREDSPWYPTMRLFRQRRPGDWPEVIERVRDALAQQFGA